MAGTLIGKRRDSVGNIKHETIIFRGREPKSLRHHRIGVFVCHIHIYICANCLLFGFILFQSLLSCSSGNPEWFSSSDGVYNQIVFGNV